MFEAQSRSSIPPGRPAPAPHQGGAAHADPRGSPSAGRPRAAGRAVAPPVPDDAHRTAAGHRSRGPAAPGRLSRLRLAARPGGRPGGQRGRHGPPPRLRVPHLPRDGRRAGAGRGHGRLHGQPPRAVARRPVRPRGFALRAGQRRRRRPRPARRGLGAGREAGRAHRLRGVLLRRRRQLRGRRARGDEPRRRHERTRGVRVPEQPVGPVGAQRAPDRGRVGGRARRRLRHARHRRRRRRRRGGLHRRARGAGPRPRRRRAQPGRGADLPGRTALHLRRHLPLPRPRRRARRRAARPAAPCARRAGGGRASRRRVLRAGRGRGPRRGRAHPRRRQHDSRAGRFGPVHHVYREPTEELARQRRVWQEEVA